MENKSFIHLLSSSRFVNIRNVLEIYRSRCIYIWSKIVLVSYHSENLCKKDAYKYLQSSYKESINIKLSTIKNHIGKKKQILCGFVCLLLLPFQGFVEVLLNVWAKRKWFRAKRRILYKLQSGLYVSVRHVFICARPDFSYLHSTYHLFNLFSIVLTFV